MQYIFHPISKAVTIISGSDLVVLNGPFKNQREAIAAAQKYTSDAKQKNDQAGEK